MNSYENCRMYKKEYPDIGDLVMCVINDINSINIQVSLLEYNNKQAMMLISNLSNKRIRSISKLLYIGKKDVLQVINVNKEKDYIDLSKKSIQKEEIYKYKKQYKKDKTVHNIVKHVAITNKLPLEELLNKLNWPSYNMFKNLVDNNEYNNDELTPNIKNDLLKIIKYRFTEHIIKLQVDIELTCFNIRGIDAIKEALKAGINLDKSINIRLISSPLYSVTIETTNKEDGILSLENVINTISKKI